MYRKVLQWDKLPRIQQHIYYFNILSMHGMLHHIVLFEQYDDITNTQNYEFTLFSSDHGSADTDISTHIYLIDLSDTLYQ
jgi:hypothetical protein